MALTFEDYLPVIIAAVLSFGSALIILVIGRHMNVFDKTRQQSTLTTVNIGNVQEDMKELKDMHKEMKDFITDKIDEQEKNSREEFRRVFEKVEKVSTEVYNLGWRVRELEGSNHKRGNGSGGSVL